MADAEQTIQAAAKLYDARASARTLLGEKYADRIGRSALIIKMVMDKEGVNEIIAGVRLASRLAKDGRGFESVVMLAAAVEMSEGNVSDKAEGGQSND